MVRFLLEKGKGIKVVDMGEEWEGAVTYRSPGKCNQDIVDFVLKQGANLSLTDSHNPWAWRRVYWRPKGRNDDSDSDTDEYLIADPPHIPLSRTGLHWAAVHRHAPLLKLLLEKGAKIDHQDILLKTALSEAASHGAKEVVRLLLEGGASVDEPDIYRRTPLHHAACDGDDGLVRLLLEHGADDTATDITGQTPLQLGEEEEADLPSLEEVYEGRMRDIKKESVAFYNAAMRGDIRVTDEMKKNGGTGRYIDGAVRHMAHNGNEAMVKMLLMNGAKDFLEEGMNALQFAVWVKSH